MNNINKVLFLDESGDHSLDVIDPQYPMFVLGGVILDMNYAKNELEQKIRTFKKTMFGTEEIILHTADISRNRRGYERMKESNFREEFFNGLNELMRNLNYQVVACAVRKDHHLDHYGLSAVDPYMLALHVLVERFCFEIGDNEDSGLIVAEKRNPTLDHELNLAWLSLKIRGTRFQQAKDIEKRITDLVTRDKKKNIAGLQLADLVVSPIGRHVLGKPEKKISESLRKSSEKTGTEIMQDMAWSFCLDKKRARTRYAVPS